MQKKYTHIFFDLDNTLWDFGTNSRYAMESVYEQQKIEEQQVCFSHFFEVYERHNEQLWDLYRKKEVVKKELTCLRFQLTFEELNITGFDAQAMNDLYLTEMPKHNFLVDGAAELVKLLKEKGYKLYIITNGFTEVQYNKLKNSGLLPYFDKVFISEAIKAPKPAREIFEYAIKSANAKKELSLMVGDDSEVDVAGAVNFGIDAVHYNPPVLTNRKKIYSNLSSQKVFCITQLADLIEIL